MIEPGEWTVEFFDSPQCSVGFRAWLDSLSNAKFEAVSAAIQLVLIPNGLLLVNTAWLRQVDKGIFEFRIRHPANLIFKMHSLTATTKGYAQEKILIRVFLHFYGARKILLLSGYDKAGDDKPRRQQSEIAQARKRLAQWKASLK